MILRLHGPGTQGCDVLMTPGEKLQIGPLPGACQGPCLSFDHSQWLSHPFSLAVIQHVITDVSAVYQGAPWVLKLPLQNKTVFRALAHLTF